MERKGESEEAGRRETLLPPLIWLEVDACGEPETSRLLFRSSGKREVRVERRLEEVEERSSLSGRVGFEAAGVGGSWAAAAAAAGRSDWLGGDARADSDSGGEPGWWWW